MVNKSVNVRIFTTAPLSKIFFLPRFFHPSADLPHDRQQKASVPPLITIHPTANFDNLFFIRGMFVIEMECSKRSLGRWRDTPVGISR